MSIESINELINRAPEWLGGAELWRLIAAFLVVLLVMTLRRVVATVVLGRLLNAARRTRFTYDEQIIRALQPSISGLFLVLGVYVAVQFLQLPSEPYDVAEFVDNSLAVAVALLVIVAVHRLSAVVADSLDSFATRSDPALRGQFRVVFRQLLSITTWIIGLLVIVQNLGYSVTSVLTGLGIGGLAVALGAQETLSNFFGSMMLLTDRPFKVGDWIQVDETIDGDVEQIGFRSTKVRAWDKSLISIPNKDLAARVIKNWSRMPKRRVKQVIGVTYDTPPGKMRELVAGIEQILRSDPAVDQDFVMVKFIDFSAYSLDVLVYYFTRDIGWINHLAAREAINLRIMECVQELGLSFAFPTQTLHLQREGREPS